MIADLIADGAIGDAHMLTANLAYMLEHVERMRRPELAGGALLDLGVYVLNFASMVLGDDISNILTATQMLETGVDKQDVITITYADGRMGRALRRDELRGATTAAWYMGPGCTLLADNIINPKVITVISRLASPGKRAPITHRRQITGFEYQVQAAVDAIEQGRVECDAMPHEETIRMMRLMDDIRAQWGMTYPEE